VDDCTNFVSSSWAERAAALGWDAVALFGCRRNHPLSYLGSAGLLWALNGGRLIELHRGWAVIDLPVLHRDALTTLTGAVDCAL
jgi:hypothetical protein